MDRHQEEEDVGEMEITIANCKKNIILNNCRLLLGKQHKEMKAEDHNHCCKVVFWGDRLSWRLTGAKVY